MICLKYVNNKRYVWKEVKVSLLPYYLVHKQRSFQPVETFIDLQIFAWISYTGGMDVIFRRFRENVKYVGNYHWYYIPRIDKTS